MTLGTGGKEDLLFKSSGQKAARHAGRRDGRPEEARNNVDDDDDYDDDDDDDDDYDIQLKAAWDQETREGELMSFLVETQRCENQPSSAVRGHVEVTWRSRGGRVEVTWRSRPDHVEVTSRSRGGHVEVMWRSRPDHVEVTSRSRGGHVEVT
ncbi:hypothetical protein EYF80_056950 [Liparis tanakae]|uniref:Uncharacterized protein n=1 Tax=Liparis tanakae TaxID=230148 RepID=A0A4Z2EVH3_9TELE|nr:hypothetical protein EYF80_056950 [Liparis tanakae]